MQYVNILANKRPIDGKANPCIIANIDPNISNNLLFFA